MLKRHFGFLKVKWLYLTGEVDKSVSFSCQIFSGFNIPKSLKSVNFFKIKGERFGGHRWCKISSRRVDRRNVLST